MRPIPASQSHQRPRSAVGWAASTARSAVRSVETVDQVVAVAVAVAGMVLGVALAGAPARAEAAEATSAVEVAVDRATQTGPPQPEPTSGTATFTDLTGPGACSFLGEPPDNLHVGLSSAEYGSAAACGGYLDVTGPSGTVRVKITDHCRNCAPGLIDVTRTAFARIADVAAGRVPVTYRLVRNPPLAEPISLRVDGGSSSGWLQIQALDHGNPLARFELEQDGAWRRLVHTADNHWMAADPGPGAGPFAVRITDVFGQQVTIAGVQLAPGVVQPTGARLYRSDDAAPSPPAKRSSRPTSPATARSRGDAVLAPPLSVPPPSGRALVPPSTEPGEQAAADHDDGDSGDDGTILPVFLMLVATLALTRALVWWRSRQRLRPTPQ